MYLWCVQLWKTSVLGINARVIVIAAWDTAVPHLAYSLVFGAEINSSTILICFGIWKKNKTKTIYLGSIIMGIAYPWYFHIQPRWNSQSVITGTSFLRPSRYCSLLLSHNRMFLPTKQNNVNFNTPVSFTYMSEWLTNAFSTVLREWYTWGGH